MSSRRLSRGRFSRGRLSAFGRIGALVLVLLVLAGAIALTAPVPWPVTGLPGVTQLVALRGLLALAGAAGAILVAAAAVLTRRRAVLSRALVAAAAGLALVAAVHVGVLAQRGGLLAGPDPAPLDGDIVVVALNTQGGVGAADLAALVVGRGADVVALPETDEATAEAVVALLGEQGLEFGSWSVVGSGGLNPATAVLVSASLGDYQLTATGPASSLTVTGTGPAITAVHARAPVSPDPRAWSISTRWAVSACAANPGGIVAGDFNATLDHPAFAELGDCADAAALGAVAAVGTWPSVLPREFGAPIDHVLVDPTVWQVVRARVLDPPAGTDHRVVEVVLDRR